MKKTTTRMGPDRELREMTKLMELEDRRDEMRRLEEQRIEHERRLRQQGATAPRAVGLSDHGWLDRTR